MMFFFVDLPIRGGELDMLVVGSSPNSYLCALAVFTLFAAETKYFGFDQDF